MVPWRWLFAARRSMSSIYAATPTPFVVNALVHACHIVVIVGVIVVVGQVVVSLILLQINTHTLNSVLDCFDLTDQIFHHTLQFIN